MKCALYFTSLVSLPAYVKRQAERSSACVIPMFANINYTDAFTIEKL